MTFSAEIKAELCRVPLGRPCCCIAELYGILLCAPAFGERGIRVTSSHAGVLRRTTLLLSRVFELEIIPEGTGGRQALTIQDAASLRRVLDGFGYDLGPRVTYHLNRNVLENDCCAAAFLRGVFLMAGSVASPDKKSHLELKIGHSPLSREIMSLMLDSGISPRCTERTAGSLIYLKETAGIEDFLTLIGASGAAMAIMEAKVEKNLRNHVNRQVNCEAANLLKTSNASQRQIAAIEAALAQGGIEIFPENLRETVDLRVAYPEASLSELAAKFSPPISKPGLDHRLKRILKIAAQQGG